MSSVLPDELVARWRALGLPIPTGEDNDSGVVSFRVNTLKTDVATALAELASAGVDSIICGPGDLDQAHQPNESCAREAYESGTALVGRVIERLCT